MSASPDAVHWRRKNSAGSEHGGNDYCKVVGEAYQEKEDARTDQMNLFR
jgi:hypothetical protein